MKKIINYILLIVSLGLTYWIFFYKNDFSNFPQLIGKTNKFYLSLGFLCIILYWILDAYMIYKIRKVLDIEGSFKSSFIITMIGQYYGAITPFSSGSQPAQIYLLINNGFPVGTVSSLMIIRFLIYQLVITFYSIFMFIVNFNFLLDEVRFAIPFIAIGCLLNLFILLMIIRFFRNEKLIKKISSKVFVIGHKLKLIKDIKKLENKIDKGLVDYAVSINHMKEDKRITLLLILTSFLQLTFYFSITYFVYLAIGLIGFSFLDIIGIQSLHYMAVSFMPTPGTVGAAEGGFYVLYNTIFPREILVFAMILWRFISYYFVIIMGGIVTFANFIYERRKNKDRHN